MMKTPNPMTWSNKMEANISFVWSHCLGDMSRRNSLNFSTGPDWVGTPLMGTKLDPKALANNSQLASVRYRRRTGLGFLHMGKSASPGSLAGVETVDDVLALVREQGGRVTSARRL